MEKLLLISPFKSTLPDAHGFSSIPPLPRAGLTVRCGLAVAAVTIALAATGGVDLRAGQSDVFSDGKAAASELGQVNLFTAGGPNRGGPASAATLADPSSITVDPLSGKVFVADRSNHRVLRYASAEALSDGVAAESVLGQPNFVTTAAATTRSRFSDPKSVCCDGEGRLWVLDGNRVLRFDEVATLGLGANADAVLGQPDFIATAPVNDATGLGDPSAICVSVTGTLWVSSGDLNRVSRFGSAASKSDGAAADSVLGQLDFTTFAAATTLAGMSAPAGLATDLAGNLFVADAGNHRVLLFVDGDIGSSGRDADVVLGQLDGTAAIPGAGALGMTDPVGLAINSQGTLFVADRGNSRVLLFENAATLGDGGSATGVLGQNDLDAPTPLGVDRNFVSVEGVWADGNRRLWATDSGLDRVLRFETDSFQPDALIGASPSTLRGDDRYNRNGAGQSTTVVAKGLRMGRAMIRVQNDGDVSDDHGLSASRGNRFIQLSYFRSPGGNVTGSITAGNLSVSDVAADAATTLQIRATGVRKFRLRNANLRAKIEVKSLSDDSADRVNCVIQKRR